MLLKETLNSQKSRNIKKDITVAFVAIKLQKTKCAVLNFSVAL